MQGNGNTNSKIYLNIYDYPKEWLAFYTLQNTHSKYLLSCEATKKHENLTIIDNLFYLMTRDKFDYKQYTIMPIRDNFAFPWN